MKARTALLSRTPALDAIETRVLQEIPQHWNGDYASAQTRAVRAVDCIIGGYGAEQVSPLIREFDAVLRGHGDRLLDQTNALEALERAVTESWSCAFNTAWAAITYFIAGRSGGPVHVMFDNSGGIQ